MPRRVIFAPILALVALAGGIGLLLGGRAVLTTETEVIERMAARYLEEAGAGAARSDCAARPAVSDDLWLVVACGDYEYFVDAYGRLVHRNAPKVAS
ncbi:hypothetical protein [uncultured Roseovarius sp.]|uniref:hypothetical protein n=1 Tax=uncultured Roseovarius sp. TaxID=293344 RepID=UPI0026356BF3|nr:hypothetical protein [uncultured Roseovarius sp.]